MGRPAKYPIQTFNGIRFYHKPSRYYKADYREHGGLYMHRYVWECHNGPIPNGYCIHHADGNRSNNAIENLELVSINDHATYHINKNFSEIPERMGRGIIAARDAAKEWHRSDEGRRWHAEHGKRTWIGRGIEERKCINCGKNYKILKGAAKKGFCSPYCQSDYRKKSGIDDEVRSCIICRSNFTTNKYSKKKTCSKGCSNILCSRTKKSI